jgi:hypothetical protein
VIIPVNQLGLGEAPDERFDLAGIPKRPRVEWGPMNVEQLFVIVKALKYPLDCNRGAVGGGNPYEQWIGRKDPLYLVPK